MSASPTLIVGIGSPHGDDQAGWLVADRLAHIDQHDIIVRKAKSPSDLLDWLDGVDRLVICDGCRGLGNAGDVRRWTWPASGLNNGMWSGTHDMPLPTVLQLAHQLGLLPGRVDIWAVEGAAGTAMADVSRAVAAALPKLIEAIVSEILQDTPCTNAHS